MTATFESILPIFLFILAGGPLVESTHGEPRFTAPLTGFTAAVVGVILGLAVFFKDDGSVLSFAFIPGK